MGTISGELLNEYENAKMEEFKDKLNEEIDALTVDEVDRAFFMDFLDSFEFPTAKEWAFAFVTASDEL